MRTIKDLKVKLFTGCTDKAQIVAAKQSGFNHQSVAFEESECAGLPGLRPRPRRRRAGPAHFLRILLE